MASLDYFAQQELNKAEQKNKLRSLSIFEFQNQNEILFQGKKLTSFATNDYFGMANNIEVKEAAINAITQYGVGGKSARLICGNYELYNKLESNLAKFKHTQKAIVFGSGYLTAIGVIPAIIGRKDLVIADKLIHSSLLDGIKLSGATLKRYNHNDYKHCQEILKLERKKHNNCLLVSETIFSMDGDLGDIKQLSLLAKEFDSWLLTDDAHGFAITENKEKSDNHIQMGTLSKTIGSYGGYIAASNNICNYIITKAKSFIYTTSLPYPAIAAANKSIEILSNNHNLKNKLQENINFFTTNMGLKKQISPIFIIETKSIKELNNIHQKLIDNGIYVGKIRPPTSPTPRLRITLSTTHSITEIEKLCELL